MELYSADCVSCGACAAICPTCTCFLLIDRPDFEKIRQLDACQYPGFERVAAGEDPSGRASCQVQKPLPVQVRLEALEIQIFDMHRVRQVHRYMHRKNKQK
jgi:ferredoxin